jgi:hypothetical protein
MNKHKNCGCNHHHVHGYCDCHKEPHFNSCDPKTDLLCTYYSAERLLPSKIEPGDDGITVVKKLNTALEDLSEQINIDPTNIDSIGGKVDIYKGLSAAFIHEIKSIQGEKGVIVENIIPPGQSCNNSTEYINVRIDTAWLTDFLNQWILTVDLCPLIENCTTPPIHTPGTTDIVKSIINRGEYIFNVNDFLTHFTDSQGHPLASINITGTTNGYTFNNAPYVSGTELTLAQITSGTLKYTGDNLDTAYVKTVSYKAKDSMGVDSNTSEIIINVGAKVFLTFNTPTVNLIRGVANTKTSSIGYSNGTGQLMGNGLVLIIQGTPGQPGYLKVTTTTQTTLTTSGTIPILVESFPNLAQADQNVPFTFDGSVGNIHLVYNSNPVTQDVIVDLGNRGSHTFTTAEFLSKYTDFDMDAMIEMRATGNVSNYLFNGLPYVAGTWIPVNDIDELTYTGANQNAAYQQMTPWQAKDAQGNIST